MSWEDTLPHQECAFLVLTDPRGSLSTATDQIGPPVTPSDPATRLDIMSLGRAIHELLSAGIEPGTHWAYKTGRERGGGGIYIFVGS